MPGNGKTDWFKDWEYGPEMVVVPAGSFMMGTPESEHPVGRETPQHKVTILQPFAVARDAVTRGQFAAFVNNTNHKMTGGAHVLKAGGNEFTLDPNVSWLYPGFLQEDSHPVVCVNWNDANAYAAWLSQTTGKPYRLLSEAEREYVTRAGTTTSFWWGSSITSAQANYGGKATVPVGSFEPNPWGLYQVHRNVHEWCEDAAHANYNGAPINGSAWLQGGDFSRRMARGGSWWEHDPNFVCASTRYEFSCDCRYVDHGFRLARTLNP